MRQCSVIGHEQQAFAIFVQSSNREQARSFLGREKRENRSALIVVGTANQACRFVQYIRGACLCTGDGLTIHGHQICRGIDG